MTRTGDCDAMGTPIIDVSRPLGRRRSVDPRDFAYRASDHLREVTPGGLEVPRSALKVVAKAVPDWAADAVAANKGKPYRYHKRGPQLDQGATARCVAFAYAQAVMSGPVMQNIVTLLQRQPDLLIGRLGAEHFPRTMQTERTNTTGLLDAFLADAYFWMQGNDEWDGREPSYYGTSERAGAQFFRALGFWDAFYHLQTAEEIARYIILHGPVPIGTDWFTGMDRPDAAGFLRVEGGWRGGHMWLLDGVHLTKWGEPVFRMRQSWGNHPYGYALITMSDVAKLMRWGAGAIAVPELRIPRELRTPAPVRKAA